MSTKDAILATAAEPQEPAKDGEFELFDLNDLEKGQLQALAELVQQSRLAQDVIYTNLVQSVAARYELQNMTIEIDMADVFKNGAANAKLRAKKASEDETTGEEPEEGADEE